VVGPQRYFPNRLIRVRSLFRPQSMKIDPHLVALFGSETRVRVLAVLAGAYRPITAYRVGKTGSVPMPKAYREIYRLENAGLVGRKGDGWVLLDNDVRTLLRKRVRILWLEDFSAERRRAAPRRQAILHRLADLPTPRFPKGWKPREPERFRRDPGKDEILRELGLRKSQHGSSQ
jgi:hypothetical protein